MDDARALNDGVPAFVRAESVIMLRTTEWLVGAPLTLRASWWWGDWSCWCTAEDEVAFRAYLRVGPLIVFRRLDGMARWQLHPATREFRDGRGRRASWRGFVTRHPEVLEAFAWDVRVPVAEAVAAVTHGVAWPRFSARAAAVVDGGTDGTALLD